MPVLRSKILAIDPDRRWDRDIFKTVHESLPYRVPDFVAATFLDRAIEITYAQAEGDEFPEQDVMDLVTEVSKNFRDIEEQIFESFIGTPLITDENPFDAMVARGMITSTGRGKFCYGGDFAQIHQALDAKIKSLGIGLGGVEEIYPTTIETATLMDLGYLGSFPHHAIFAAPANLARASLNCVSDPAIMTPENRLGVTQHLGFPDEILAPTVCYHCFEARRGRRVARGVVTAINKCHRHEPVDVVALERLTTYWMREVIIFDDEATVQARLGQCVDWTTAFLRELGVSFKIVSANDPFFADRSASKRLFQSAFDLKREIKVPVFGGKWISIASFNNHQNSIVPKLNISDEQGDPISSGCAGWGFERLIFGIISHLGPDVSAWPIAKRQAVGLSGYKT